MSARASRTPGRDVRAAAPVFAALGDPTRLRIVSRLAAGSGLSIKTLTAGSGLTRQAVTKHLQILGGAGLVESSWQGRERIWALKPTQLDAARRALDQIAAEWSGALGRLQRYLERPAP